MKEAEESKERDEGESLAELLAELKDLSELMIDLAYSSLLLQSKDLASLVLEIEDYMDELHTKFELKVLETGRERVDDRGTLGLIRLSSSAENISDAAAEMAKIVLREIPMHPIFKMVMQESEEILEVVTVEEGSYLEGRTLGELELESSIGMKVVAIRSGYKWTYNPSPSFRLLPGDLLIVKGYSEGREAIRRMASKESQTSILV
ncbi:MAG: TrkA C-terminal domain-containing protein [Candidatus Bathyarchaeia archaeon]